jgi:hypothetical protein
MFEEALVNILIPVSFFALVFGVMYMRNKENMSLIERGINPRQQSRRPQPFISLKYGLLLLGAGIGLLAAYFIDRTIGHKVVSAAGTVHYEDNPAIYFSLIAIGGGIGLIISYSIEKKHGLDKVQED